MASPGLESFCCQNLSAYYPRPDGHSIKQDSFQTNGYNAICILSSLCSIVGALFLIFSCKNCRDTRPADVGRRRLDPSIPPGYSKRIIAWLAVADLLACTGILVRALVWLIDPDEEDHVIEDGNLDFAHIFCAISSGWIQYFYLSTYMWTFCYALDIVFMVKNKQSRQILYHILGWGVSGCLCLAGIIPLYYPSLLMCQYDLLNTVPHFLSYYIPLVFVMITNPLLYIYASKLVKGLVSGRSGRYTDSERSIVVRIREKFFLIMLVFYVCWLVNVINGILLIFKHQVSSGVFVALWNAMAVLNPLQAVLNTLVYKGIAGGICRNRQHTANSHINSHHNSTTRNEFARSFNYSTDNETSPLLNFRR
ncbi:G-protein coupled receptor 143-like [Lineus longissimus]|uniref:G-protein coupled receptor 143-like n=1 Tax=Lineus longissimus TaxID=88925 RepID=UPI002B4D762E